MTPTLRPVERAIGALDRRRKFYIPRV